MKQQDDSHKKLCEENREKIKPIIETVLFLGQNTLPFRNSESNILDLNELQHQEGLFRRSLRFRVQSGDENLRKHLENAPKNAVYISPKIQNAFISCIGQEIKDNVLQKIRKANFYVIMADEATDISSTEQLSLCIRYV